MSKVDTILVTGGAGFIGHHFVEHLIKNTNNSRIVVLDKLNYSGTLDRLRDVNVFDDKRVQVLTADFTKPIEANLAKEIGNVNFIVHMGAETHVDNSISDPWPFVESNVVGTYHLLEYARTLKNLEQFIYFSTDEVFGPAPQDVLYREGDRHNPSNPYAATKSAGEQLCTSYANTFKLPIIITNTMNVFGERQHPEKFIPMCVKKIMAGQVVTIHGSPDGKSGSRYYIHARNVADALLWIMATIKDREHMLRIDDPASGHYNIVGEREITNLKLAEVIAALLGKDLKYKMVDFHSSRPGHDLRYALNGQKMRQYGWTHPMRIEESLDRTIKWMLDEDNKKWLEI